MRIDDRVLGMLFCLLGIVVVVHSAGFPGVPGHFYGPAMFPTLIGAGFAVCGLLLFGAGLRKAGAGGSGTGGGSGTDGGSGDEATAGTRGAWFAFPDWRGSPRALAGVALTLGAIVAFALFGDRIGFPVLAFVTLTLLYLTAGRGLLRSAGAALVVAVLMSVLFGKVLRVPLPPGLLVDLPWW